jgi:NADH dehydrogenase
LELQKKNMPNLHIRLVSNRDNFEYHGALYRLVAGRSLLEVCLPLRRILDSSRVDIIKDHITHLDKKNRVATGVSGSTYKHDILVVAVGSKTNYFGIPGLEEHAWGMKTIKDALALKQHIHNTLDMCTNAHAHEGPMRYVVIGAGPTGVEMAGELASYVRTQASRCGLDPNQVQIELVEQSSRILPTLSAVLAKRITKRLRCIGVQAHLGCSVQEVSARQVVCADGTTFDTDTTIWTAGVRACELVDDLDVAQDKQGRIRVDEHLRVPGWDHVYVAGDVAATPHSGMAQTAIHDGRYIANCIAQENNDSYTMLPDYYAGEPIWAIPVGSRWAGTQWGKARFYGYVGWMLRRLVDWVVFINFLSFGKALAAFRSHYHVQSESNHTQE